MYRQAHRKIRLWLGEDYQFSAVIRDANGIPVDLTGATAALKLEPYLGGGSTYNADLAVRSDGVVSVQLNGHEMYRQMLPGLYKYVVTIGLDDALLIGESGTVQAIAGYEGLTVSSDVDITGAAWAPPSVSGSDDESVTANEPPVAGYTYTADGLDFEFVSTSTDSDGTIVSTIWSFGDGDTATGATASHTYAEAGTYTVTVTVVDNDGAADSYSEDIAIIPDGYYGLWDGDLNYFTLTEPGPSRGAVASRKAYLEGTIYLARAVLHGKTSGKWGFVIQPLPTITDFHMVGLSYYGPGDSSGIIHVDGYNGDPTHWTNGSPVQPFTFELGDYVVICFDADAKKAWWGKAQITDSDWTFVGDPVAGTGSLIDPSTFAGSPVFTAACGSRYASSGIDRIIADPALMPCPLPDGFEPLHL